MVIIPRVFSSLTNGTAGKITLEVCRDIRVLFFLVSPHLIDLHSEMLPQHETVFHRFFFFPSRFFFVVDSDVVCRKRIKDMKKMQDEQLKTEIKNLEAMQQSAYDQIRFHRLAQSSIEMKCRCHRSNQSRTDSFGM